MNNAINPNYFELTSDAALINFIEKTAAKYGQFTYGEQTKLALAVVEGKKRGLREAFKPVGFNTSMVAAYNANEYKKNFIA